MVTIRKDGEAAPDEVAPLFDLFFPLCYNDPGHLTLRLSIRTPFPGVCCMESFDDSR